MRLMCNRFDVIFLQGVLTESKILSEDATIL